MTPMSAWGVARGDSGNVVADAESSYGDRSSPSQHPPPSPAELDFPLRQWFRWDAQAEDADTLLVIKRDLRWNIG